MSCCLFYNESFNKHKEIYIQICFISSRLLYTISRTTTTIRNNNNNDDNNNDDDDEREKRKTISISMCIFLKQNVYAIDDETAIAERN